MFDTKQCYLKETARHIHKYKTICNTSTMEIAYYHLYLNRY